MGCPTKQSTRVKVRLLDSNLIENWILSGSVVYRLTCAHGFDAIFYFYVEI